MIKFLTQHSNQKDFFIELKEGEYFMYSYLDFKWEDVISIAKENGVKIEYIQKGTAEYKLYGECAAKVVKRISKNYEFKTNLNEIFHIEANSEKDAKIKLMNLLFEKNLITVKEVS